MNATQPSREFSRLTVRTNRRICWATLANPPINLFDTQMVAEISALLDILESERDVMVCVFDSADPDFFIAHYDLEALAEEPTGTAPTGAGPFNRLMERFRDSPVISIGVLRGAARGGGSEFLLSLDMRFAAAETATLSQPEVALGIVPGGGASVRLPELTGRGCALEIILGCQDFSAQEAARYGWVNRAIPAERLDEFVTELATAIASYPAEAIALAKAAVNRALPHNSEGLADEALYLDITRSLTDTRRRMSAFLHAGGQTREGERRFGELLAGLARPEPKRQDALGPADS
jgi:enoyl-CoA hydratase/carnithine racemase